MKRLMLLSLVASLATLAIGTSASAQAVAMKPRFATIACKASTAVCVNLDLYAKMAQTGPGKASGVSGAALGGTSRSEAVTGRKGRAAAGGTENNPAESGGRTAMRTRAGSQAASLVVRNDQARLVQQARPSRQSRAGQAHRLMRHGDDPTINNPDSSSGGSTQRRAQAVERVTSRPRVHAANSGVRTQLRSREVTRHRPTDF